MFVSEDGPFQAILKTSNFELCSTIHFPLKWHLCRYHIKLGWDKICLKGRGYWGLIVVDLNEILLPRDLHSCVFQLGTRLYVQTFMWNAEISSEEWMRFDWKKLGLLNIFTPKISNKIHRHAFTHMYIYTYSLSSLSGCYCKLSFETCWRLKDALFECHHVLQLPILWCNLDNDASLLKERTHIHKDANMVVQLILLSVYSCQFFWDNWY